MNQALKTEREKYPGGETYLNKINSAYDDLKFKKTLNFKGYLEQVLGTLKTFLSNNLSECKTTGSTKVLYGMSKYNPFRSDNSRRTLKLEKNKDKIKQGCKDTQLYNNIKKVIDNKRGVSLFNSDLASTNGYVHMLLKKENTMGLENRLRVELLKIDKNRDGSQNYDEFFVEGTEINPNHQNIKKLFEILSPPTGSNPDQEFTDKIDSLNRAYEEFVKPFKPQYISSSFNKYDVGINQFINILNSIDNYISFTKLKIPVTKPSIEVVEEDEVDENERAILNPIRRGNNGTVAKRKSNKLSSNDTLTNAEIRNISQLLQQVLDITQSTETQKTVSIIKEELNEEELDYDNLIQLAEQLGKNGTKLVEMLKNKKAEFEKAKGVTITAEQTEPKVNELKSQLVSQQAILLEMQKQLKELNSKTSTSGSLTPTTSTFENSDTAKWYNYQLETLKYINSLPEFTDAELKAYFNDTNPDTSFILLLEKVIKGKNAKYTLKDGEFNVILNDKQKIEEKIRELTALGAPAAVTAPAASPTAPAAVTTAPAVTAAPPAVTENQSKIELLQSIVDGNVALEKYEALIDTFNRKIINKIRTTPNNDTLIIINQLLNHIKDINDLSQATYGGYKVKSKKTKKSKKSKKNRSKRRSKGRSKPSRRRR